jgi:hypothetical protein
MAHQLATRQDVTFGGHRLRAFLDVPERAAGLVIFAHGSGSGRHSQRNQYAAAGLNRSAMATLLEAYRPDLAGLKRPLRANLTPGVPRYSLASCGIKF